MLVAITLLAMAAFFLLRGLRQREQPLDREELLIIRGLADRLRKDEIHPFE